MIGYHNHRAIEIIRDLSLAAFGRAWSRHQPVAQGPRHSRMRGWSAIFSRERKLFFARYPADSRTIAAPRARRRQGDPLCRQHPRDRLKRAIAETDRRREKQVEYNTINGITPKASTLDPLHHEHVYDAIPRRAGRDREGGMADDVISIVHNFGPSSRPRNPDARIRADPSIRESRALLRVSQTPAQRHRVCAVVDDPPRSKLRGAEHGPSPMPGMKKYGEWIANFPSAAMKKRGALRRRSGGAPFPPPAGSERSKPLSRSWRWAHDPHLHIHKPISTKCTAPNPCLHGPGRPPVFRRTTPDRASGAKSFQATDSRQSGPEFGGLAPAPPEGAGTSGVVEKRDLIWF